MFFRPQLLNLQHTLCRNTNGVLRMNLTNFLQKNQFVKINATEKQPALNELTAELQNLGFIENKNRYYAQIVHRESLENTGIGNSIAIPHARTDSVSDFCTIIGICDPPLDYQSFDKKPVKYIMLSLFPTDMSTKYLYLIGMIARIFNNKDNNAFLSGSPSPEELYDFLCEKSDSYFKSISEDINEQESSNADLVGVPSSDLDILIKLDRLYKLYDEQGKSESIKVKINELKKLIDNRSLTYYERMRKKRSNPFAIVEKTSCSGCHMEIPPVNLVSIKEKEAVQVCTYCGRFLIMI